MMTVRELINELLDCDMDAHVMIKKELDWNVWVNSYAEIISKKDAVVLSFDFPTEQFDIQRKKKVE